MPLNAQISLSLVAHESTAGDISKQMRVTPATYAATLTEGTGANQAQVVWSDSATVIEGNDYSFTFANLVDDRGTVTITALKAVYMRNTGTAAVVVEPYLWGSGPFSGTIDLLPGAAFVFVATTAAGWGTTGSGASILVSNTNSGIDVPVEVVLIGEGTIA